MGALTSRMNASRVSLAVFLLFFISLQSPLANDLGEGARIFLSVLLFLWAPGFVPAMRLKDRLGLCFAETVPVAVSLSIGQAAVFLFIFDKLPLSILDARWALLLLTLCWYLWEELRAHRGEKASAAAFAPAAAHSAGRISVVVLWALIVGLCVLLLKAGAPLNWQADSAAHISAIRGVIEEDRLFPVHQPYGPGGVERADPRFGVFHALCAIVAITAKGELYRLWGILPGFLAPVLVLGFYFAARSITGSARIALLGALLFPVCYGGIGGESLRLTVYPNRVSFLIYLVSLGVLFRYVAGQARWLLGLLGALIATVASVHVYHVVEFIYVMTCFFLAKFLVTRADRGGVLREWAYAFGVTLVAAFPMVAFRLATAYGSTNQYAAEGQGILLLGGGRYILSPLAVYAAIGPAGLVSILLLPYFLRRLRKHDSFVFVSAATIGPLVIVLNPWLMPVATRVLSYLATRLIAAVPFTLSAAMFLTDLPFGAGALPAHRRLFRILGLILLLLALLFTLNHKVTFYKETLLRRDRAFPNDMSAIADDVERLDRIADGRRMFLSDPVTAYAIPAFSRQYVTAIPFAHASPTDPFPVSRVRDAMDVLNSRVGLEKTASILRKYKVDYVVVNTSFRERLSAFEYEIDPGFQARALEKLSSAAVLFRQVVSDGGVHVFRFVGSETGGYAPDLPRAGVTTEGDTVRMGVAGFTGMFKLEETEILEKTVEPGDSLRVRLLWHCYSPPAPEDVYRLFVRLDTPFPKGKWFMQPLEKPYRKILERRLGEHFRFRQDVDPETFDWPLHLWKQGQTVPETVTVGIPEDVAPGVYTVSVSLKRITHITNFAFSDYLREDDYYSGVHVGQVEIRRRRGT